MFAFGGGSRLGKENRLQDTFRNTFGTGIQKDSFKITPTLYILGRTLAFTRERKSSWCSLRAEIRDRILCKIPIYMC